MRMSFKVLFNKIHLLDAAEQFDVYTFVLSGNIIFFFGALLITFLLIFFLINLSRSSAAVFVINYLLNLVKITVENNMSNRNFNYTVYLPFFYVLFFFIFLLNLVGLVPFTYTVTSLLVVPFFLSGINFFFTTAIGVRKHGLFFFGGFLPAGTNIFIAPLLILIEIISYFVKVVSLAVRLFANMFAGHVLIKVLLSLAWSLLIKITVLPIFLATALSLLVIAILVLELFICCLQAYVFVNLASIYLDQAVNFLGH